MPDRSDIFSRVQRGRAGRRPLCALVIGLIFGLGAAQVGANDAYPRLRDQHDPALQALLNQSVLRLGLEKAVDRGRLAIALVDITDRKAPRVARLNGDNMMYAASLPKIGILLAAMHDVEDGRLRWSEELKRSLHDMIRVSSNVEATRVMNLVGNRRVNEILASPRFRLYDPAANGGLWVGKEYGKSPAFQRDPLHNISHGATAMQVARFYYLLETDRLLGSESNAIMKQTLARPGIKHKFVKGLRGANCAIFRKSGTWARWHADSALVETASRKYILVALAEDKRGGEWLSRLARTVHGRLTPSRVAER